MWFLYREDSWWIASAAGSVKVRNVTGDPRVSLALQDGAAPVVAEGLAVVHRTDFPAEIRAAFAAKYRDWDITATDPDGHRALLQVTVTRWLLSGMAQ